MPSCQTPSDPAINLSSLSGKHFPAGEILPKAELRNSIFFLPKQNRLYDAGFLYILSFTMPGLVLDM